MSLTATQSDSTDTDRDTESQQQSLNVLSDSLIIERYSNGGHRKVVDQFPDDTDDEQVKFDETDSEVGKPQVEYPRERDHYTIRKYRYRKTYRHCSDSFISEFKEFDITIDRDAHPKDAEHFEDLLALVRECPALEEELKDLETYDDVLANQARIRRYEAIYDTLMNIWGKDSLATYVLDRTARQFEIDQFPQGFYCVPRPHHDNVASILGDELASRSLGKLSIAWGGYVVQPGDFDEVYDVIQAVYHTPDDDKIIEP